MRGSGGVRKRVAKPGYIYVLDPNVEVNGRRVYKIGYTTQTVQKRARQLSTGSIDNLRVAYQQHVSDAPIIERCVHHALAHARINREFFAVTLEEAKREIQRAGPSAKMKEENLKWAGAMCEFKDRIGARGAERRVEVASCLAAFGIASFWVVTTCIAAYFLDAVQILEALILIPFAAAFAWKLVHRHLQSKLVETPFGEQIAAESGRLDTRFPSSFQATWRQQADNV